MARRGRRRRYSVERPVQRGEIYPVFTPLSRTGLLRRSRQSRRQNLIGDRRFLENRLFSPRRDLSPARVVVATPREERRKAAPPFSLAFKAPRGVMVCVRRRSRREVLFARGSVGRGSRVSSRRRRNENSDIRC